MGLDHFNIKKSDFLHTFCGLCACACRMNTDRPLSVAHVQNADIMDTCKRASICIDAHYTVEWSTSSSLCAKRSLLFVNCACLRLLGLSRTGKKRARMGLCTPEQTDARAHAPVACTSACAQMRMRIQPEAPLIDYLTINHLPLQDLHSASQHDHLAARVVIPLVFR